MICCPKTTGVSKDENPVSAALSNTSPTPLNVKLDPASDEKCGSPQVVPRPDTTGTCAGITRAQVLNAADLPCAAQMICFAVSGKMDAKYEVLEWGLQPGNGKPAPDPTVTSLPFAP